MLGFASISELAIGEGAESANAVSGWKASHFGAPSIALTVQSLRPMRFGVPAVAVAQFVDASGFRPVYFGVGTIGCTFQVSGFAPLHFGGPSLLPHVVGFKPAHIGMPGLALDAVSLRPAQFGAITALQRNRVSSWRAQHLGTPTVPTNRSITCASWRPARFGRVTSLRLLSAIPRHHGHVYALRPVHFGTPTI